MFKSCLVLCNLFKKKGDAANWSLFLEAYKVK